MEMRKKTKGTSGNAGGLVKWKRRTASYPAVLEKLTHPSGSIQYTDPGLKQVNRSLLKSSIHMSAVAIGEQVEERRPSLLFNQRFINEIQTRQKSPGLASMSPLKKGMSVSLTEINFRPDSGVQEIKKNKPFLPRKSLLIKRKQPSDGQQINAFFPMKPANIGFRHYKTALYLLRLRERLQQRPKSKCNFPFNVPASPQTTLTSQVPVPVKSKDSGEKVMLIQCPPYRIAVDYHMYRNVKKISEGKLRAMFNDS